MTLGGDKLQDSLRKPQPVVTTKWPDGLIASWFIGWGNGPLPRLTLLTNCDAS
jgi:hypothetical protein